MQGLATSIYLGTGSISALHTSPYLTSPYLTLPRLTSPNLVRPPTGPCDGCTSLSLNLTIPRVRIPEQINICECASSSHLLSVRPRVQSQRRQGPSSCNGGRRGSGTPCRYEYYKARRTTRTRSDVRERSTLHPDPTLWHPAQLLRPQLSIEPCTSTSIRSYGVKSGVLRRRLLPCLGPDRLMSVFQSPETAPRTRLFRVDNVHCSRTHGMMH